MFLGLLRRTVVGGRYIAVVQETRGRLGNRDFLFFPNFLRVRFFCSKVSRRFSNFSYVGNGVVISLVYVRSRLVMEGRESEFLVRLLRRVIRTMDV